MSYTIIPRQVNVDNVTLETNEIGEIQIKTPGLFSGLFPFKKRYLSNTTPLFVDTSLYQTNSNTFVKLTEATINKDLGVVKIGGGCAQQLSGSYGWIYEIRRGTEVLLTDTKIGTGLQSKYKDVELFKNDVIEVWVRTIETTTSNVNFLSYGIYGTFEEMQEGEPFTSNDITF